MQVCSKKSVEIAFEVITGPDKKNIIAIKELADTCYVNPILLDFILCWIHKLYDANLDVRCTRLSFHFIFPFKWNLAGNSRSWRLLQIISCASLVTIFVFV